jgi:hypothetical protein
MILKCFNIFSPSLRGVVCFVWIEAAGKQAVTPAFKEAGARKYTSSQG